MIDVEYILRWNWIKDNKWLYSERRGRNIDVPEIVDIIIKTYYQIDAAWRIPLIEGYLFGPEIFDNDGGNQLEGELKRFVALQENVEPRGVVLCKEHVIQYGEQYNLNNTTSKLLERLGL